MQKPEQPAIEPLILSDRHTQIDVPRAARAARENRKMLRTAASRARKEIRARNGK